MARKYDVTKMIESTTIYFKEFSLEKGAIVDAMEDVKDYDDTMSDEKTITMLRNKFNHPNAVMIIGKKKVSAYYGMSKETFTKYAKPTNNKDGRNLIKRTLNAYNVSYMYYNMNTSGFEYSNVFIDKIDENEIFTLKGVNLVRKLRESESIRIVYVNDYDKVSEMYGMTTSDFIKYADVISSDEMSVDDENANE